MVTILVADDVQDNLLLISRILEARGYTVITATNGNDALSLTAENHPDLVLMDLSMPLLNGWDATHAIKQQPELAHIPIIALTAHALTGDRERAVAAGCDDFITKPFEIRQLLSTVQAHLKAA